jgi:Holliday junction resolvasome RuvABC ATP-dependent DNA helicase subunit
MNKITLTIEGNAGLGKTALATIVQRELIEQSIEVVAQGKEVNTLDSFPKNSLLDILKNSEIEINVIEGEKL